MRFVITRQEDGKYVAKPGSRNSYTKRLEDARIFEEHEVWKEKCSNEIAIPLEHIFGGAY